MDNISPSSCVNDNRGTISKTFYDCGIKKLFITLESDTWLCVFLCGGFISLCMKMVTLSCTYLRSCTGLPMDFSIVINAFGDFYLVTGVQALKKKNLCTQSKHILFLEILD